MATTDQRSGGVDWSQAGCLGRPVLPWTGDPGTTTPGQVARMRDVCRACPLRLVCRITANRLNATAGFWAGKWATHPADHTTPLTQAVIPFTEHGEAA